MRVVDIRFLLVLLLVLLGATAIFGLNMEDDDRPMAWMRQIQPLQAQPPHANPEDKTRTLAAMPAPHSSRNDSKLVSRFGTSLIALVCVLRC